MRKELNPNLVYPGFLALFVLMTACSPDPTDNPLPADTPFIPMAGMTSIATPPGAQATMTVNSAEAQATVDSKTLVVIGTPTERIGADMTLMVNNDGPTPFLADEQGRSLYIYMNDSQNKGISACVDDCAVEWPPLTVSSIPAAGLGVEASLLGTLPRAGGSLQATYNGWPLYYYVLDTTPGTTNGPSVDGLWFLVSPAGEPVRR